MLAGCHGDGRSSSRDAALAAENLSTSCSAAGQTVPTERKCLVYGGRHSPPSAGSRRPDLRLSVGGSPAAVDTHSSSGLCFTELVLLEAVELLHCRTEAAHR